GFAGSLVLRDADALAVFSLFAAVVLLTIAAGRAATAWASRGQPSDFAFAALRVGLLCAAGPLGWGRAAPDPDSDTDPDPDPDPNSRATGWTRKARTVARGTLLALPALLVLAALLMSADPVFDRVIRDTFLIEIEPLIEHLFFAAVIAWLTSGFLRAFLVRDDAVMRQIAVPRPALAAAEVSVALWILNLLFIVFMAVQLRYLF